MRRIRAFQLKYPGSKWLKYQTMRGNPALVRYLPVTSNYDLRTLQFYLKRFKTVFLKPTYGTGGKGIIRIVQSDGVYRVQTLDSTRDGLSLSRTLGWINRKIGKKAYLLQEGISLLTMNGKPMDLRILMLKPDMKWTIMGMMGKIAANQRFITNHCRGGDSITLPEAFKRKGMSDKKSKELQSKLEQLALEVANTLQLQFPNIRELGLDIALDQSFNMYILEANTKPRYELFQDHENPELYKIIRDTIAQLR